MTILRLIFLLSIVFLFNVDGIAQKRYVVDGYDSSFYHVKRLKGAEAIIRLKTKENSIYYLMAQGRHEEAAEIKKKQLEKNKEIVDAFQRMYSFCDVKFFYSNQSVNIRNGFYEGFFLDENLEEDETIKLRDTSNFYIIDVGDIYFPSFGSHMEGVVMMDRNFKPLPKPFPYFVRKRSGLFLLRRSYLEVVRIFDSQIHDFYDYTIGGGEYEAKE